MSSITTSTGRARVDDTDWQLFRNANPRRERMDGANAKGTPCVELDVLHRVERSKSPRSGATETGNTVAPGGLVEWGRRAELEIPFVSHASAACPSSSGSGASWARHPDATIPTMLTISLQPPSRRVVI
jgi:hypothetical protein